MPSEYIDIEAADGGTFKAYLATPESGAGPAIVLCQEIFGVNLHIREVADQWAAEGFTVLAPDLFWRLEPGLDIGYEGADLEHARALYKRLDLDLAVSDTLATMARAKTLPGHTGKVGLVGFCFGGKLIYLVAAAGKPDCAIGYYGVGIEKMLDKLDDIGCPLMLHFGGADGSTPPEAVDAIARALGARDDASVFVYPGAAHGFNNWRKKTFDGPGSQRAFAHSLTLARRALA